ncbi:general transcription factor IIH subunit 2 Ssl1 isoform X1 [Haemaphysalis longicornis]
MADDEEGKGYRWETEYERTWEAIQEDESGLLQSSVLDFVHRAKRKQMLAKKNVRLGMMRHLYIVVDFSEAMAEPDLKPTRLICTLKMLELFIAEFFDQNPISNVGIISTCNKRAQKLCELAGNAGKLVEALQSCKSRLPSGEPSLQNALELAAQVLRHLPVHTSREVLIVLGSLTTCDPGNIHTTIESMCKGNIRCSVVGLAAEVHVCCKLTKSTGGTYSVIMDENHFRDVLFQHAIPPPVTGNAESSLIRMGFPFHRTESEGKPSLCFCHLDSPTPSDGLSQGGYFCPQCNGKYCNLPVECKGCGLTLVSAPHLARSYHHLFALEAFQEVPQDALPAARAPVTCFSCQASICDKHVYRCSKCQEDFCLECDLFVHDTLHTCPGCASKPSAPEVAVS